MKKSSKYIYTYNPNKQVEIKVTNTPKFEDEEFVDFDRTVTIKVKLGRDKEQKQFATDKEIAKFVETVDFEDPQESLV